MKTTGIAVEDLVWSQKWSYWFRRQVSVTSTADQWHHKASEAYSLAGKLREFQRVAPTSLENTRRIFDRRLIERLSAEAEDLLKSEASLHNGKWNAQFGDAIYDLLEEIDLVQVITEFTGAKVSQPHGGTYIAYLNENEHLDFHLDHYEFGDINMLLCISHTPPDDGSKPSSTVTLGAEGLSHFPLQPGDALVFDGSFTPHGRTPLSRGEKVILASLAFNVEPAIPWEESNLPNADAHLALQDK